MFSEGETIEEARTNLLDALTQVMEYHREEARKRVTVQVGHVGQASQPAGEGGFQPPGRRPAARGWKPREPAAWKAALPEQSPPLSPDLEVHVAPLERGAFGRGQIGQSDIVIGQGPDFRGAGGG